MIKHALGLRHAYGDNFSLVYFWHYVSSEIGDLHRKEVVAFDEIARNDIAFTAVTVEELFRRFTPDRESRPWFDYMTERYLNLEHP